MRAKILILLSPFLLLFSCNSDKLPVYGEKIAVIKTENGKETIDSFIRESILFYLNEEEDFRQRYITNVRKLNQRIRSEILDNAKARMNFRLNINNTIRNIQECIDIAIENIKARLRDLNESKHKYLEKYNDFLNEQQEEGKQRPQFISLNKLGTLQSLLIAEYPNKNNYSLSILNIYLSSLYLLCLGDTNIMKAHIGYWKETSNNKEELFNPLNKIKNVIAVIPIPPKMAPKYLTFFSY